LGTAGTIFSLKLKNASKFIKKCKKWPKCTYAILFPDGKSSGEGFVKTRWNLVE
jgi:hypothetical protein